MEAEPWDYYLSRLCSLQPPMASWKFQLYFEAQLLFLAQTWQYLVNLRQTLQIANCSHSSTEHAGTNHFIDLPLPQGLVQATERAGVPLGTLLEDNLIERNVILC